MKKVILAALVFSPAFAFAQGNLGNLNSILLGVGRLVNNALPIVFALALLAFFWGLAKFILAQGNEDAKEQGKRIMIGGIIALFVMASIWGLVNFIQSAFDVNEIQNITPPSVQIPTN
ncbi:MAG: hypothetical protein CO183_01225 [Candidatus Zambryskibacteria bacterium CG_4_9_14_3_um_filter_42_9]|uniref:Uncharacterized protein n=1 Tax=Candidatus Zambryskibacteria bacterium CG22_combo_CG10-13_8_21_14_all_42_17 TaxID=1975118 RepID=A0A2H0BE75_9BACT|nr:MAG: hypothetical protein COX06_00500 [Candidatus Zambryskibacteria bacterium CG22_combo_CG10-13_8_21_14_all_42_17]PJA36871.1 MAG: hypothetical protein CO183_01225 [Candidatus Zambryskibacteria bacterium CG_4_9_14_3_um_filter_42_9]